MKKLGRKQVIVGMLSAAMVLGSAVPALAAQGWQQNQTGWWYENSDGSYVTSGWREIGGAWYYFNASGYMATGWVQDGGRWYFNNASGAMQTGWINVNGEYYYLNPVSDGTRGAMVTGEAVIGGVSYFFNESGACTNILSLTAAVPRYNADGSAYNADDYPKGGGSGSGSSSTDNQKVPAEVTETNEKVVENVKDAVAGASDIINKDDPKAPIKYVEFPGSNTATPAFTIVLNGALDETTEVSAVGDALVSIAESIYDPETMESIVYAGHTYTSDEMDDAFKLLADASKSTRPLSSLKSEYKIVVNLKTGKSVTYTINVKAL